MKRSSAAPSTTTSPCTAASVPKLCAVDRAVRRDQHHVARRLAVEDDCGRDRGDVLEVLAQRRELRAREAERRVVDHVLHVDAAGPQHTVDLARGTRGWSGATGTERLPNASPTTRSRESSASSRMPSRASPIRTCKARERAQPELVAPEVEHRGVDLEHGAPAAGPGRREVAREREPAAARCAARRAGGRGEGGVDRVGERARVVELEVRRDRRGRRSCDGGRRARGCGRWHGTGRARRACSSTRSRPGTARCWRRPSVNPPAANTTISAIDEGGGVATARP